MNEQSVENVSTRLPPRFHRRSRSSRPSTRTSRRCTSRFLEQDVRRGTGNEMRPSLHDLLDFFLALTVVRCCLSLLFYSFFISRFYFSFMWHEYCSWLCERIVTGKFWRRTSGLKTPGWLAAGGGCSGKLLYQSAETNCSAVESVASNAAVWLARMLKPAHSDMLTHWVRTGWLRPVFVTFPLSGSLLYVSMRCKKKVQTYTHDILVQTTRFCTTTDVY